MTPTQRVSHASSSKHAANGKRLKVAFRFDDYASSSNTAIEKRIIKAFMDVGAPITFAVIPFEAPPYQDGAVQTLAPLAPEKAQILRQAAEMDTVDVALHGYTHCSIREGDPAEFIGYGVEHQQQRLLQGKKTLEDITGKPVTTFVPPWNQYDRDTLIALDATGFTLLSARADAPGYGNSTLAFLPATTGLTGARQAIDAARHSDGDNIVVILFHEYDFTEIDMQRGCVNFDEFCQLLAWVKEQPDVEILSLSQVHARTKDLSTTRYDRNRHTGIMARLIPAFWSRRQKGFYHDGGSVYHNYLAKTLLFYGLLGLCAGALSFLIASALFHVSRMLVELGAVASVILAGAIVYRAFRSLDPFMRGASLSAVAVGASVGCVSTLLGV